jgi:hypothetical protein
MSFFTLSYVLLWVLVAFESLVLVLVLRELGVLYLGRREAFVRDGPDEGKPLPDLQAVGHDGSVRTLMDLPGEYRALVFGAQKCPICGPVMEKFARWSHRVDGLSSVLLIEGPSSMDGNALATKVQTSPIWWLREGEMLKTFGVRVSPFAVMVDAQGKVVAKGLVNHHGDIKRFIQAARDMRLRRATKSHAPRELAVAGNTRITVDNGR